MGGGWVGASTRRPEPKDRALWGAEGTSSGPRASPQGQDGPGRSSGGAGVCPLSGPPCLSWGVDTDKGQCVGTDAETAGARGKQQACYLSQSEGEDLASRPCRTRDCARHEGTQGLRSLWAKRTAAQTGGRTHRASRGGPPRRSDACAGRRVGGRDGGGSRPVHLPESKLTGGPASTGGRVTCPVSCPTGLHPPSQPQRESWGAGSPAVGPLWLLSLVCKTRGGEESGGRCDPSPPLLPGGGDRLTPMDSGEGSCPRGCGTWRMLGSRAAPLDPPRGSSPHPACGLWGLGGGRGSRLEGSEGAGPAGAARCCPAGGSRVGSGLVSLLGAPPGSLGDSQPQQPRGRRPEKAGDAAGARPEEQRNPL